MADFNTARAIWLMCEGEFSTNAGGTMSGITQGLYDAYRRGNSQPPQRVALITPVERDGILQEYFWRPYQCVALPQEWGNFMLVEGGNLPFGGAAKIMQQALAWAGFYKGAIDGDIGPVTIAAAKVGPRVVETAIIMAAGHYAVDSAQNLQNGLRRRLAILRQACRETGGGGEWAGTHSQ